MTFEMMKLELRQTLGIKAKIERILDLFVEFLRELKDFSVFHDITFGESWLFILTIFRAIWYVCFGVKNNNYDYYFSELTWTLIFVVCSLAHLGSFFLQSVKPRCFIFLIYGFVWTFLAILAGISGTSAPAIPTYAALTLGSVFLAVRLWHEE